MKKLVVFVMIFLCSPGCRFFTSSQPAGVISYQDSISNPEFAAAERGGRIPTEKDKVTLPTYRASPPDILLIDALQVMPKEPYQLQRLDILQIIIENAAPGSELADQIAVNPDGEVNLGSLYGKVKVLGLTADEAATKIEQSVRAQLNTPVVSVSILQTSGQEQIAGEHVIAPDGTVNLGTYGQVYVAGKTLDEIRIAIEKHLSQYLEAPRVAIDIFAYNTMVYYIIVEGAGQGEQVVKLPITGNETVMDAIAALGGTSQFSNKNNMWIARPTPAHIHCDQILPVHWVEISKGGSSKTNYQLLPGDRLFIAADRLVAADSMMATFISPFERVFGFGLLAGQTIQILQRFPRGFRSGF